MSSSSEKQSRVVEILESVRIKDTGIPEDVITSIMEIVGEPDERPRESSSPTSKAVTEAQLRIQIAQEQDWRKKAALCAMLISNSLD